MIGDKARAWHEERAKERQGTRTDIKETLPESSKGQARDAAGKAVGVSGRTMDKATKVLKKGDVAQAVDFFVQASLGLRPSLLRSLGRIFATIRRACQ